MGDLKNPFREALLPLEKGLTELIPLLLRLKTVVGPCTDAREMPDREEFAEFVGAFRLTVLSVRGLSSILVDVTLFIQVTALSTGAITAEQFKESLEALGVTLPLEDLELGPETSGPAFEDEDEGGGGHEPS